MKNQKDSPGTEPSSNQGLSSVDLQDDKSTEKFVRDNVLWMLKTARRILGDDGLAEDAVQTAFGSIFRGLASFQGRSSLKTWMYRIVVNEALMQLRKRERRREWSIDELLPVFDDNGCRIEQDWASFETPEILLQRSETKEVVSELIGQLPENYRIVLLLRDIEEMSTAEVAEVLELSEANVKVRLHRARAALKKLLEPLLRGEQL